MVSTESSKTQSCDVRKQQGLLQQQWSARQHRRPRHISRAVLKLLRHRGNIFQRLPGISQNVIRKGHHRLPFEHRPRARYRVSSVRMCLLSSETSRDTPSSPWFLPFCQAHVLVLQCVASARAPSPVSARRQVPSQANTSSVSCCRKNLRSAPSTNSTGRGADESSRSDQAELFQHQLAAFQFACCPCPSSNFLRRNLFTSSREMKLPLHRTLDCQTRVFASERKDVVDGFSATRLFQLLSADAQPQRWFSLIATAAASPRGKLAGTGSGVVPGFTGATLSGDVDPCAAIAGGPKKTTTQSPVNTY